MTHIKDWCVSRPHSWGHRIPAWYAPPRDDLSQCWVAPTVEDAQKLAGRADLVQDEDVLDPWFSAALWPMSTLGWPDDTRDLRTFYPTSVMATGHDIIFSRVARMLLLG